MPYLLKLLFVLPFVAAVTAAAIVPTRLTLSEALAIKLDASCFFADTTVFFPASWDLKGVLCSYLGLILLLDGGQVFLAALDREEGAVGFLGGIVGQQVVDRAV